MTRHEIQLRRTAGITERAVAEQTGVSVRSVRRITNEPPVTARKGRRGWTGSLIAPWDDRVAA